MRIGVDLGGTKIEFVALSEDGGILSRNRVHTPVGDYQATIEAIRTGILAIEQKLGLSGTVGVGIPGSVSPATLFCIFDGGLFIRHLQMKILG